MAGVRAEEKMFYFPEPDFFVLEKRLLHFKTVVKIFATLHRQPSVNLLALNAYREKTMLTMP